MNKFNVKDCKLIFTFDNSDAANHFKSWLCGSGEQNYWIWMECRESEETGNITGIEFDYHNKNIISVKCGRLDDDQW